MGCKAVLFRGGDDFRGMSSIPGFYGYVYADALGRNIEEQSAVRYLQNIGAKITKAAGETPEQTGGVAGGDADGCDTVATLQLPHHD